MPTKTLPATPSLEHLKYQAKDLLKARTTRDPGSRSAYPRVSPAIQVVHRRRDCIR